MEAELVRWSPEIRPICAKRVYGASHDVQHLMRLLRQRAKHLSRTMSWECVAIGVAEITELARCTEDLVREVELSSAPDKVVTRVGQSIKHTQTLLRTVAGPEVSLNYQLPVDEARVEISVPALDQVLINLVANARNAGARNINISVARDSVPAGEGSPVSCCGCVTIAVEDDGCSISDAMLERAVALNNSDFEPPWFGAGLTTVKNIARSAGGGLNLLKVGSSGLRVEVQLPLVP